jgi:hypothetical protein
MSGTLDAGDLYGAVVDEMGNPKLIDSAATGITLTLATIPQTQSGMPMQPGMPSGVSGDLVGNWSSGASGAVLSYVFKGDSTFQYDGIITSRTGMICITVSLHKEGSYSVTGNQISFVPSVATKATNQTCSNMLVTPLPDDTTPFALLWRMAPNPDTGTMTLYLTDPNTNNELGYTK